jgi:hypothetical protein
MAAILIFPFIQKYHTAGFACFLGPLPHKISNIYICMQQWCKRFSDLTTSKYHVGKNFGWKLKGKKVAQCSCIVLRKSVNWFKPSSKWKFTHLSRIS